MLRNTETPATGINQAPMRPKLVSAWVVVVQGGSIGLSKHRLFEQATPRPDTDATTNHGTRPAVHSHTPKPFT